MKIIKIFFPGDFEDAYLYMGRLLVLTQDRTFRIYYLDTIVDYLESSFPSTVPVPELMFSRNDWLGSSLFKSIMKNKEAAEGVLSAFERFSQSAIAVDGMNLIAKEEELKIPASVILDINIYNGRLYAGADTGFYHVDIEWERSDTTLRGKEVRRRLEARCLNTSAKSGAINASCGDDGLFTAIDDFGWRRQDHPRETMVRLAERSLKTTWFKYDLMNYPTPVTPFLLQSEQETVGRMGIDQEQRVLTRIGSKTIRLNPLFELVQHKYDVQLDSIQFTYNSNSVVFIHTITGNFYSVGMQIKDSSLDVRFTKMYQGTNARILSAHPSKVGMVLETDDRVWLFAKGEWFSIIDSEVLAVRTFARSRRFQNIVAVTTEEGLFLIGLFDDSELLAPLSDNHNGDPRRALSQIGGTFGRRS